MAFRVSIGFPYQRSGAALVLSRGEKLAGVDLLPAVAVVLACYWVA